MYKVNSRRPDGRKAWHFDRYFSYRGRKPFPMGGTGWIRSPQSWSRLARVRKGDLFVCYQSDERRVYGLTRAAGRGYETEPGSGRPNAVDFAPRGLRLRTPVDVRWKPVRELFRHIRAFTVPSRGTVHSLTPDELRELLRALARYNPAQKKELSPRIGSKGLRRHR